MKWRRNTHDARLDAMLQEEEFEDERNDHHHNGHFLEEEEEEEAEIAMLRWRDEEFDYDDVMNENQGVRNC